MKLAIIINLLIIALVVVGLFWFFRSSGAQKQVLNFQSQTFRIL